MIPITDFMKKKEILYMSFFCIFQLMKTDQGLIDDINSNTI